ncbi:MAG: L,D-transpeptidase family protein, partial [Rhodoblastus sp.]|nr:L,D-transpeptidase family protein [Rhodoblastus sp.]
MTCVDRRSFVRGAIGAGVVLTGGLAIGEETLKEISQLKPGEFTWHPERAAEGPVSVVVSIPQQRVHVYRNGVRVAVSTCSTGKAGHETPTGVFVVLQKDKHHRSSTYNNAPMPNTNR